MLLAAALTLLALPQSTSFEREPAGAFTRLETALGTWTAGADEAAIDDAHASDGAQCLRLLGGERSAATLEFPERRLHAVRFRAERWTRQAPFTFTVEAREGGRWRVVGDLSAAAQVGGFHLHASVRIDAEVDALRLVCASPPERGVLIDELELVAPAPLVVERCEVVQPEYPALLGRASGVVRVDVVCRGNQAPQRVAAIVADLAGTTCRAAVRRVDLVPAADGDPPRELSGAARALPPGDAPLRFALDHELREGRNRFWLMVELAPDADLDARLDGGVHAVVLADGTELVPEVTHPAGWQRIGVVVRDAGDDGRAVYRIPALVTTVRGTLLAAYDARRDGWADLPADIDVGVSRSADGGRTWSAMQLALDLGDEERWRFDGVGDPCLVVDRLTDEVHLFGLWSHGDRGWHGSGPGLAPEETGQLVVTTSRDDGLTWSAPRNLTAEVKRPEWCLLLQGPGRGIQLQDGTLVVPAQYQASRDEGRLPRSTVLWSRDHGATWHVAEGPRERTTEAAVAEVAPGRLMLNCRDDRGGSRAVFTSDDLGATWTEHETSRGALVEPVCMASLLRVERGEDAPLLLFSNPAVAAPPRRDLAIRASPDLGERWPDARVTVLDRGTSAGYSCMTDWGPAWVGILYESSRAHLVYQRMDLGELISPGPR